MTPALPAGVEVIVRDWLTANHVLLADGPDCVLVDAGHVTTAATTVELLRAQLAGRRLREVMLTHAHSDHMGGCARLRREFGCGIAVPAGAAEVLRAWDTAALWLDMAMQQAEPFAFERTLAAGEVLELGGRRWEALAAPGHDMDALAFWCPAEGVLLSGDALWRRSLGVVLPGPGWRDRIACARDTLDRFAALPVRVVVPGHGAPFREVDDAIAICRARLDALGDERRLARHALRVMVVYLMLERGPQPADSARRLVASMPLVHLYADTYFDAEPAALTGQVVDDLLAQGALLEADGLLRAG